MKPRESEDDIIFEEHNMEVNFLSNPFDMSKKDINMSDIFLVERSISILKVDQYF